MLNTFHIDKNLIQEIDVIATKKGDEAIYYLIVKNTAVRIKFQTHSLNN